MLLTYRQPIVFVSHLTNNRCRRCKRHKRTRPVDMNVIRLRLKLQLRPDTTSFAHDQEDKIKGFPIYEKGIETHKAKRDSSPSSQPTVAMISQVGKRTRKQYAYPLNSPHAHSKEIKPIKASPTHPG
jgi:hypothetical protein